MVRVVWVEFYDCFLVLGRQIAHLGETDYGFAHPILHGMRFDVPLEHFSRFSFGQESTCYEPSVLCQETSIIEGDG